MSHQRYPQILAAYLASLSILSGKISITLDYGSTTASDIASYGAAFTAAENFWETHLTGYRDSGADAPTDVLIHVDLKYIDGVFNTLGSAGPLDANTTGNFLEATVGIMQFDTADLNYMVNNGVFENVIRHEMAHVLGFGTLWDSASALMGTGLEPNFQQVYTNGTGQYTGAAALSTYQVEYGQPNASFIPVELDGGEGTKDSHWNEVTDNFNSENLAGFDSDPGDDLAAPTIASGIHAGESLDDELMSGVLSGSAYISETTLATFYDIGFTIAELSPIPEAESAVLFGGFIVLVYTLMQRRPNQKPHSPKWS